MRRGNYINKKQASWDKAEKGRLKVAPSIYIVEDSNAGQGWIEALRVLYKARNRAKARHRRKEVGTDD